MSDVNKAILIGRLGSDPESKTLPTGTTICNFSLATGESYKDKSGEKVNKTEWHRIVTFGKLADICAKYLTKGKQVYIEGRIQTRSWDDKDGNKRYSTEIVANEMVMLGGKQDHPMQDITGVPVDQTNRNQTSISEDEIPF